MWFFDELRNIVHSTYAVLLLVVVTVVLLFKYCG
jgi:hypothetical protein